jgi:hypothetical protein
MSPVAAMGLSADDVMRMNQMAANERSDQFNQAFRTYQMQRWIRDEQPKPEKFQLGDGTLLILHPTGNSSGFRTPTERRRARLDAVMIPIQTWTFNGRPSPLASPTTRRPERQGRLHPRGVDIQQPPQALKKPPLITVKRPRGVESNLYPR